MHITISDEPNASRVILVSSNINWVYFNDNLRIELTREQLDSIVAEYESAKNRKKIYESVGIN